MSVPGMALVAAAAAIVAADAGHPTMLVCRALRTSQWAPRLPVGERGPVPEGPWGGRDCSGRSCGDPAAATAGGGGCGGSGPSTGRGSSGDGDWAVAVGGGPAVAVMA